MRPRVFSIDINGSGIAGDAAFFREDVEKIRLVFSDDGDAVDYSSASVKLGIGSIGSPTAGTFKISDAVATSAGISFAATAAQLKTALDAMNTSAGLFSAGACTVTGAMPRYTVTVGANNTGNVSNLSSADNTLTPDSAIRFVQRQAASSTKPLVFDMIFSRAPAVLQTSWTSVGGAVTPSVTTLVNGSTGSNEVQIITFPQTPDAGTWAITMPARNVTISSVSANVFTSVNHGLYDGQSVTLTAFTISAGFSNGSQYYIANRTKDTFQVSSSRGGSALAASVVSGGGTAQLPAIVVGPIAYNASMTEVAEAFVAAGFSDQSQRQIIPTGTVGQEYRLTFAGGSSNINFAPVTIISDLSTAPGLEANISCNTFGVRDAIERGDSELLMEVEVARGGARKTYRTNAAFSADLLADASFAPVAVPYAGSMTLQSPDASLWSITIDNDGSLTATKQ